MKLSKVDKSRAAKIFPLPAEPSFQVSLVPPSFAARLGWEAAKTPQSCAELLVSSIADYRGFDAGDEQAKVASPARLVSALLKSSDERAVAALKEIIASIERLISNAAEDPRDEVIRTLRARVAELEAKLEGDSPKA